MNSLISMLTGGVTPVKFPSTNEGGGGVLAGMKVSVDFNVYDADKYEAIVKSLGGVLIAKEVWDDSNVLICDQNTTAKRLKSARNVHIQPIYSQWLLKCQSTSSKVPFDDYYVYVSDQYPQQVDLCGNMSDLENDFMNIFDEVTSLADESDEEEGAGAIAPRKRRSSSSSSSMPRRGSSLPNRSSSHQSELSRLTDGGGNNIPLPNFKPYVPPLIIQSPLASRRSERLIEQDSDVESDDSGESLGDIMAMDTGMSIPIFHFDRWPPIAAADISDLEEATSHMPVAKSHKKKKSKNVNNVKTMKLDFNNIDKKHPRKGRAFDTTVTTHAAYDSDASSRRGLKRGSSDRDRNTTKGGKGVKVKAPIAKAAVTGKMITLPSGKIVTEGRYIALQALHIKNRKHLKDDSPEPSRRGDRAAAASAKKPAPAKRPEASTRRGSENNREVAEGKKFEMTEARRKQLEWLHARNKKSNDGKVPSFEVFLSSPQPCKANKLKRKREPESPPPATRKKREMSPLQKAALAKLHEANRKREPESPPPATRKKREMSPLQKAALAKLHKANRTKSAEPVIPLAGRRSEVVVAPSMRPDVNPPAGGRRGGKGDARSSKQNAQELPIAAAAPLAYSGPDLSTLPYALALLHDPYYVKPRKTFVGKSQIKKTASAKKARAEPRAVDSLVREVNNYSSSSSSYHLNNDFSTVPAAASSHEPYHVKSGIRGSSDQSNPQPRQKAFRPLTAWEHRHAYHVFLTGFEDDLYNNVEKAVDEFNLQNSSLAMNQNQQLQRQMLSVVSQERGGQKLPHSTDFIVTCCESNRRTFPMIMALARGIPILTEDFIFDSYSSGQLVDKTDPKYRYHRFRHVPVGRPQSALFRNCGNIFMGHIPGLTAVDRYEPRLFADVLDETGCKVVTKLADADCIVFRNKAVCKTFMRRTKIIGAQERILTLIKSSKAYLTEFFIDALEQGRSDIITIANYRKYRITAEDVDWKQTDEKNVVWNDDRDEDEARRNNSSRQKTHAQKPPSRSSSRGSKGGAASMGAVGSSGGSRRPLSSVTSTYHGTPKIEYDCAEFAADVSIAHRISKSNPNPKRSPGGGRQQQQQAVQSTEPSKERKRSATGLGLAGDIILSASPDSWTKGRQTASSSLFV